MFSTVLSYRMSNCPDTRYSTLVMLISARKVDWLATLYEDWFQEM